ANDKPLTASDGKYSFTITKDTTIKVTYEDASTPQPGQEDKFYSLTVVDKEDGIRDLTEANADDKYKANTEISFKVKAKGYKKAQVCLENGDESVYLTPDDDGYYRFIMTGDASLTLSYTGKSTGSSHSGGSGSGTSVAPDKKPDKEAGTGTEKKPQTEPKDRDVSYTLTIGSKVYTMSVDGKTSQGQLDVAATISKDRTMLPVRFVGEVIGADVQWDAATRTASFSKDGLTATVQIDGQQIVLSNGKTVDMDSAPLNVDGRILLPLTNISQIFSLTQGNVNDGIGQDIEWDGQNRTVTIKTQRAYVDNKPEPKAQKNAYVLAIGSKGYTLSKTDGEVLQGQMDVAAIISNGRTMLPVRFVGEVIGADVQWDAATRTASFSKDGLTATIQIDGQQIVLSDGRTVDMDSAPLNVDGRILLPLTNISQVFSLTQGNTKDGIDQDIEWDGDSRTVTIRA
ncbi:MAG: copper amine oxidase N-terminal domain-containing protein, partial [Peptococcus niger]|nr:copper amine oxidase N-terminal domain-containing protein [Peptococcus niger]